MKRPLQPFQLAERGSSIAAVGKLPGTGEAGFLVGRVGQGELAPATGSPQQLVMKLPQPVAWSFQPRLVRVVREQLAGPPVSSGGCGRQSLGIAIQGSDSLLGIAFELVDVYDEVSVRK